MVKKVTSFLNKKNSITSASIILMATLFFSNVLGVFRDHYLTQKIPTEMLSVYYAAFRIPDFIFNILILGAITSAFIPVFTNLISRQKEEEAWRVAVSIINLAFIVLVFFSVLLAIFMPYVMPLVVPGFDSEKQILAVALARIMLFSPIIFGLSYIFGGILNSYKRFLVYSLAPLFYNFTIILGTLIFADKFGVFGVSVAVVIGAFLHFLIQLPVAIKLGFRWRPIIDWKHWGVQRIGLLMLPRSLALGANQIMLLIFTAMASSIGGYSIAVYNLADNIQTMPMVVFGTSFATAIFPSLSESFSQNNYNDFKTQIKKITRIVLFFMIPLTFIFILLRSQIVRLILGSGHFGWEQTISTADTLAYFSLSLVFTGLMPLFARGFYAMHNTKIPMIITFINVVTSIILAKFLSAHFGVSGLAMAFSIGAALSTIVIYFLLEKKVKLGFGKELFFFILKIFGATLLMVLALQEVKTIIGLWVDMHTFIGVAWQTLGSLFAGLCVYFAACWVFGCEEILALKYVFQKYAGRANGIEEISRSNNK